MNEDRFCIDLHTDRKEHLDFPVNTYVSNNPEDVLASLSLLLGNTLSGISKIVIWDINHGECKSKGTSPVELLKKTQTLQLQGEPEGTKEYYEDKIVDIYSRIKRFYIYLMQFLMQLKISIQTESEKVPKDIVDAQVLTLDNVLVNLRKEVKELEKQLPEDVDPEVFPEIKEK